MSTAIAPSTPKSQLVQAPISTPSPGNWTHPKFDEIVRRQNANSLGDEDIRKIIWNGTALALLCLVGSQINPRSRWYNLIVPQSAQGYDPYARLLLAALFIYNIAITLAPMLKVKDNLTDIPLTPTQRAALGLDPNAAPTPNTATSSYITPPRYSRSPTPRNSPLGSRSRSPAASPGSRRGSPLSGRQGSDSPFLPSPSPLWQKAVGGGRDATRRHSYSSSSPLGPGTGKDLSALGAPGTPSPSTGRGTSVGLNSKWLYERGRASPSNRSLYS